MAYIGPEPAESFTSFATQEFSTSATTSYTLDHAVANENEIALFVNNVRQQPGSGKAYTASGTALTLSAATASTDTMYCVFLGRALQTVTPATNSITSSMVASSFPLGITVAGQFRLSANITNIDNTNYVTSNWEEVDTQYSRIGSAITQSSGIFTFPSTGIYYVSAQFNFRDDADQDYVGGNISYTSDNSSYAKLTRSLTHIERESATRYGMVSVAGILDVTDTSNVKVQLQVESSSDNFDLLGDSAVTTTGILFLRLGDT